MRQALAGILHQRFAYFILLALLFILLAFIGPARSPLGTNVQGEASSDSENVVSQKGSASIFSNTDSSRPSGENKQKPSNTRIHVSLKTSVVNSETTGSTSISITQNGETQIFEEVFNGNRVRINVDNGEFEIEEENGSIKIDFDSRNKTKSENETSFELNIEEEHEVDD